MNKTRLNRPNTTKRLEVRYCPKCNARFHHKNIVSVYKCNQCGYQRKDSDE